MRFSFLRNAASVSGATLISRIGGFIRDVLLAQLLGAQAAADIFVVAFRLPNLFRRLFAEGAFSAAFVPLLSEVSAKDKGAAHEFAAQILTGLALLLFLVVIVAEIFMEEIIAALAPGFVIRFAETPQLLDAAVLYARLAFPYLFFVGLAAYFSACLNVAGRFTLAALAPVLLNIILISAIGLAFFNNATTTAAPFYNNALDYIIVGVLLAGVAQTLPLWWAARKIGWRINFAWPKWGKYEQKFLALAAPALLAGGVGQINLLVGTAIATGQAGAAAWLYYADRLYQLPLALIGVALSVVLLPDLAARLAQITSTDLRQYLNNIWATACAVSIAAAVGLFVLSVPATRLLFEGGAFSPADSAAVASAVQIFCFGLPAFILLRPVQAVFFAHFDTRAPFIDGLISVIVNIALALFLFPIYGFMAIAVATSVAAWMNLLFLLARLAHRGIWHIDLSLAGQMLRQCLAALFMGVAIYALFAAAPPTLLEQVLAGGILMRTAALFVLALIILLGVACFAAFVFLFGGIKKENFEINKS